MSQEKMTSAGGATALDFWGMLRKEREHAIGGVASGKSIAGRQGHEKAEPM